MNEVKKSMQKEVEEHRGELCFDVLDLVELVVFGEDDEDFYYVVRTLKGRIYWSSGVMTPIWLKSQLREGDYNSLKYWWDMNKKSLKSCN